ncbi:MFS transporter, partial [Methylobacterium organophilum]|nr:MFS transporter [Methylobacterium organophilum]
MSASSTGAPSTLLAAADAGRRTRVRLLIVAMLFAATTINYADRATISIAGPDMAKELGLSPVQMGYVFSAFAWSYVLAQIPGGWLLDRYSVKWVYAAAVALWSAFTLVQGAVGFFNGLTAVVLRLPENHRIEAAFAVGRKIPEADLTEEQRPRETPNGRRP